MNQTIMLKEIKEQPEKIMACYEKNKEVIPVIAQAIKEFQPTNILMVARGTSMHSAIYAKYLFQIYYHLPVSIAAPSVFTVYDADVNLSQTLVIGISQSGGGKDIHRVLEKANHAGALTLAITNTPDSIIAKEATYQLDNAVDKAVSYGATKTYTSTMYLLVELLYELTHHKDLEIEIDHFVKAIEHGLDYYDQIKELVKNYEDATTTFTMARGRLLSLAMELALKMKETSHYPVNAYPCSEFYHGPIVMVNEQTPTILFGIDRVTNENVKKMILDLHNFQVPTLAISNQKNICDIAKQSIYIEEENDLYATFTAIVILQLFACELSILRGNNPDYNDKLKTIDTI